MHISSPLLALALAVSAMAAGPVGLSPRAVACTTKEGNNGVCTSTSTTCNGVFVAGLCAGGSNIQCCVPSANDAADGAGEGDSGEETVDTPADGVVPEEESKREAAAAEAVNGPLERRAPVSRGHLVYAAAARWIGTPYVWGGGNCNGPTKGGFDCSGLVLHAVCKALRKTLPHNAQRQYLSPLGRHVPRAQAQRGDTIYWATNGNCRSAIKHVAIVKDARIMLNAPNKNARVREQAIWTQSGSLRICPDAVRFW